MSAAADRGEPLRRRVRPRRPSTAASRGISRESAVASPAHAGTAAVWERADTYGADMRPGTLGVASVLASLSARCSGRDPVGAGRAGGRAASSRQPGARLPSPVGPVGSPRLGPRPARCSDTESRRQTGLLGAPVTWHRCCAGTADSAYASHARQRLTDACASGEVRPPAPDDLGRLRTPQRLRAVPRLRPAGQQDCPPGPRVVEAVWRAKSVPRSRIRVNLGR
jgi:hypothetical protein